MRKVFGLVLVCLPLIAACGKPYTIVQAASPNPFVRKGCKVVVQNVVTSDLSVGGKTDAAYAADKTPEQQASYAEDKVGFNGAFNEELRAQMPALIAPAPPQGDNTFVFRPSFVFWEPGFNVGVASRPGEARMVVDVLDPTGQKVLDQVQTRARMGGFASGSKMRSAGAMLGHNMAVYLRDRFECAGGD